MTSNDSLTETNCQLLKIETYTTKQHTTKQHKAKTDTRTKNKSRKFKENYEGKKDYLTITKKHTMENSQDGNGKNKSSTNIYISTNNITELNELIYAGAKLVCKKIGILLKSTKKKKNQNLNEKFDWKRR